MLFTVISVCAQAFTSFHACFWSSLQQWQSIYKASIVIEGGGQSIQQVHEEGIAPIAQAIKSKRLVQSLSSVSMIRH